MAITKAALFSSIYKLFYTTINTNLTNPHVAGTHYIFPAFPLNKIGESSLYPLLVIESPDVSEEEFTFSETEYTASLDISYFGTSAKNVDDYKDKLINCIENRTKTVFEANGVEFLMMESSPTTPFEHGAVKGHTFTMTFTMKIYLSRINA